MRFRVSHITHYEYADPASESFAELRLCPRATPAQEVLKRQLLIEPETGVDWYDDYFGNRVEFFSIPRRHAKVSVKSIAEVITSPVAVPEAVLQTPVAEARQIYQSTLFRLYDFLQPTGLTPLDAVGSIRRRFFRPGDSVGPSLEKLNRWIHETFTYQPGVTDVTTPLREVVKNRRGVCQDFAHLMLALLRRAGIPARYVSGYIEAFEPGKRDDGLVGAAASHAWVEVFLPGGYWWGLDPTNNQPAGERHVTVAVGRDYHDVAPMRGTYKGALDQTLRVMVSLTRRKLKS